jgi:predicted NBD/HSP70 family sugar kinase
MDKDKPYTVDRKGTKSLVLQSLRQYGSMPRIKLTSITGLSRATISTTIAELIELNLVQEMEKTPSTGGRPAITLELVPRSHLVLGAEFDSQMWTLGAFDLLGQMVETAKFPASGTSPETVLSDLAERLEPFAASLVPRPPRLLGLGMPGLVDSNKGVIQNASDLGWHNVKAADMLKKQTGWETVTLNRHRARGLAECRYGAGKDFREMIYIGVGTGIAAGLFLDRQLITGSVGGAGELGHVTIEPHGPLCPCGNHGCLQTLSGGLAIEQEARRRIRSGESSILYTNPSYDLQLIKAADVCQAADQGDSLSVSVIHRAAAFMGIAMANLVNILNPEALILGGTISKSQTFVEIAEKEMRLRAMSSLATQTEVRTTTLSEYGGALGAANFALDRHMSFALFQANQG